MALAFGQEPDSIIVPSDGDASVDSYLWRYQNAPDGYYMTLQHIEVTVHTDRTLDIVEHLDAFFTEPRHGIYRSIPRYFWVNRDVSEHQDGSKYAMRYNDVKIDNIYLSEASTQEKLDDVIDLRIGSPVVEIEGAHSYDIRYTLSLPDDRVEASDLFFHSIVGPGWTCATDSVYFEVHFDKPFPRASYDGLQVFVGTVGLEDNLADSVITRATDRLLVGSCSGIAPGEAVTIHLPLPADYFDPVSPSIWYYLSWLAAAVVLYCLLRVIGYEIKGDKPVTSVVTFQPRMGMTSADVGSLVDGHVDDVDLLSLIPWFASEGYLSIERLGADILLRKLCPLPDSAPDYQQTLWKAFFESSDTFNVSTAKATFGTAWQKAKTELERQYKGKLDKNGPGYTYYYVALLALALLICWSSVPPGGVLSGGVVYIMLLFYSVFMSSRRFFVKSISFRDFSSGCSTLLYMPIVLGVFFIMAGVLFVFPTMAGDYYLPSEITQALMALTLIVMFFLQRMLLKTDYRRERLGEVLGMQEFIRTAEKDRLEMLLAEDENYFYRILPYAMVFGLVNQWAEKFAGLTVKPRPEYSNVPVSHLPSMLHQNHYMSHISSAVRSSQASSGGSRGSAGGHSGGYSGGGSGGGGGRSW